MILQRLKEFWESQPETLPRGYGRAFLTKRIVLNADGMLVNVESLSGETKGKLHGRRFAVPREQPQRTVTIRPRLIQDNANYALGIAGPEDKPAKVAERHQAFLNLLRQCASETGEPSVQAILRFLESGGASQVAERGIDPNLDEFLFDVDGTIPSDLASVQAFWSKDEEGLRGTDLVTGEETSMVERMPIPIKGVPGGQVSGTMLVSVNNASGESYGLSAAQNSPLGAATAEAVCNGLNALLASPNHSLRLGETVYLYWTRSPEERDVLRALKSDGEEEARLLREPWLAGVRRREPDSRNVGAYLRAPLAGGAPVEVDSADFFLLALSANSSRIVVRDYHETTLDKAQSRLGRWYASLALVGLDGEPTRPYSAFALATSLFRDAQKEMPKHLPVELVRGALLGSPLPLDLLVRAVRRNVVEGGPYSTYKGVRSLSTARLCLTKAVLLSQNAFHDLDLTTMLLEDKQSPAYVCGRLLALLDTVQYYALRDPKTGRASTNATVVDRNYGAASTTPAIVLPLLIGNATKAHLPKIRKVNPGAFAALSERMESVLALLSEYPSSLDATGQGFFSLGFYHQKATDRTAGRRTEENGGDPRLKEIGAGADLGPVQDPSQESEEEAE